MRLALVLVTALVGCEGKSASPPDLTPLPQATPDLAKEELDLSAALPPEDLAPPMCLAPKPGLYYENSNFGYRNVLTGMDNYGSSGLSVAVQPDGTIIRQPSPISTVNLWHCDAETVIDPLTCEAVCCAGDLSIVPEIYFSQNGWSLFRPGQCQWRDSNNVLWYIDVQAVAGRIN